MHTFHHSESACHVHVQGFTVPGSTCVCGDSHTATHGAFGSLAFGIGTSEVEHVLATSTLALKKSKNMLVSVEGDLGAGVTSKDIVLHICGVIGTAGGTGATIEFSGEFMRMPLVTMASAATALHSSLMAAHVLQRASRLLQAQQFDPSQWKGACQFATWQ